MRYQSFSTLLVCALLFGCSSNTQVPLRMVAQTQHCPVKTSGLSVFRSNEQLEQAVQAGAGSLKQRLPSQESKNSPVLAEGTWLLVVHMGQKPSAGYSLSLASDTASVDKDTMTISLQYHQPPADSMQATVITSPCIMLSLNRDDLNPLHIDQVVAEAGDQRWEHKLTP